MVCSWLFAMSGKCPISERATVIRHVKRWTLPDWLAKLVYFVAYYLSVRHLPAKSYVTCTALLYLSDMLGKKCSSIASGLILNFIVSEEFQSLWGVFFLVSPHLPKHAGGLFGYANLPLCVKVSREYTRMAKVTKIKCSQRKKNI